MKCLETHPNPTTHPKPICQEFKCKEYQCSEPETPAGECRQMECIEFMCNKYVTGKRQKCKQIETKNLKCTNGQEDLTSCTSFKTEGFDCIEYYGDHEDHQLGIDQNCIRFEGSDFKCVDAPVDPKCDVFHLTNATCQTQKLRKPKCVEFKCKKYGCLEPNSAKNGENCTKMDCLEFICNKYTHEMEVSGKTANGCKKLEARNIKCDYKYTLPLMCNEIASGKRS